MIAIPEFLLKQMYVGGSLRQTSKGIAFDIMNRLGPGLLTGVNEFKLNEQVFSPEVITIELGEKHVPATEVTEENPVAATMGQVVTCAIDMPAVEPGFYSLTLSVISKEAGQVSLTVQDQLS